MPKGIAHSIVRDYHALCKSMSRSLTRDEYCAPVGKGKYTKTQVCEAFGSWLAFVRAAGAQASPQARQGKDKHPLQGAINKHDLIKKLSSKYDEEIRPYHNLYKARDKKTKLIFISSDWHDNFVDPFIEAVWFDDLKRSQPDDIVLNGDLVDFPEVSTHAKDPTRLNNMQGAIDKATEIFRKCREACPNATIWYVLGNHEARLWRFMMSFPQFVGLRSLEFGRLFELEKYGVNLVARKNFLVEKPRTAENWHVFNNCFVAFHGYNCSPAHAMANLRKFNMSGVSGHVHNSQYVTTKDLHGQKWWASLGCMSSFELALDYVTLPNSWNQGYGKVYIDNERPIFIPVNCQHGFVYASGKLYRKKN